MTEELLAAEQLVIGVLQPALAQHLVRQVMRVLQDRQARHQPCRQRWAARMAGVALTKPLLEELPVDLPRQPHQRVAGIDNLIKPRSQQVLLATVPTFVRSHASLARCPEPTESQSAASDQFARKRRHTL